MLHASVLQPFVLLLLLIDKLSYNTSVMSTDEGSYDYGGYMMWETPKAPYQSLSGTTLNIGLNGELVAQSVAEERGFIVEHDNKTVQISFPNNAEGGYRKVRITYEWIVVMG